MAPLRTATEAAAEIASGRLLPREFVTDCLARIEQLEPELKAWVSLNEAAALKTADDLSRGRAVGQELSAGHSRGPLHGIPVAVKDIIDVAGFPTRCGSTLTSSEPVQTDAPLVSRLRAAGAIILGKTVTTEFACFDPPITRNPWNAERTPGGSSSGSAVAVAAGMVPLALGSQTGGSVTRPAAYCGVASCKPTFGRINRTGVFPVSEHLDHVGVFARCVSDLALLLNAVQEEFCDTLPVAFDTERPAPRLAVVAPFFLEQADEEARRLTLEAVNRCLVNGAEIVAGELPGRFAQVHELHRRIMAIEAAQVHREQFARTPEQFGPCIAGLLREGLATSAAGYAEALRHQKRFTDEMAGCLPPQTILLTPATPAAAPDCTTTGDPRFNSPWSYCGLPTVSLPCGLDRDGLPHSIQLIGSAWGEAELFQTAAWCERAIDFQATPPLN